MNKNKGFSLIELMVVVAIVGILASMAVGAFDNMLQRNRLKSAVQSFQDDMQFARVQAIKQSRNVIVNRVQTSAAVGDWCYGLTTKTACTCTMATTTDTTYCEIKRVLGSSYSTVSMFTATANSTITFRRGTIGADGSTFYTSNYAARVVFSDGGRIRICTPPTVSSTVAAANRPIGTIGLPTMPVCT